ncbi:hypothetical protein DACRYDRAFT_98363 [Dacryopinax primogenitus]|uniref:ARM repeat-containing protein n=1 Tax=Dacryopinax primogenitus (strain DJM 731) TaxID=1858805 RepID=M5GBI2_DACPD|nr:uncharacterized protein DACRYDRAFT_98363 [Dacryopinax primogenitus]EJU05755.1 hypothetical protein DACRYDRAFT_98363 [Dacryopinax primogenitus]
MSSNAPALKLSADMQSDPTALAAYLEEMNKLVAGALDTDPRWTKIAKAAKSLADILRHKTEDDLHGKLGKGGLPKSITGLVKGTPGVTGVPSRGLRVPALVEVLRVGANLCADDDDNRAIFLATDYVESVLGLLESYLPWIRLPSEKDPQSKQAQPLLLDDLRVIKTAVGALLNISASFDPAKEKLLRLGAPLIVLRIIVGLYPAGGWASTSASTSIPDMKEEWLWRFGVSNWAWRALDDWREPAEDSDEDSKPIFDGASLMYLLDPLPFVLPPFPEKLPDVFNQVATRLPLIDADLEVLEQVCMSLESLALDLAEVRQLLGRSAASHTPENSYLAQIIRFVEQVQAPSYWSEHSDKDRKRWERTLAFCKAAVIKAIIAVSGEDANLDVLWNEKDESGGWFVKTMLKWIRSYKPRTKVNANEDDGYHDMAICGTLALGNLARKESHCLTLASPPISLTANLIMLLDRKTDIKLKHGVIGLLKNMGHAPGNRAIIGDAGLLEALAASRIWEQKWDIAETVQLSAIGVSKHLAQSNALNSLRLLQAGTDHNSCLEQILGLVKRSDTIAVKSEGTRVLVSVIKSLCTNNGSAIPEHERKSAMDRLVNTRSTTALAELISRSQKYPLLLNEGIIAMTLLATQTHGVPHVLSAFFSSSPSTSTTTPTSTTFSLPGSAPTSPTAPVLVPDSPAVATLVAILVNKENKYQPELRANVCALLAAMGRRVPGAAEEDAKRQEVLHNQTREALNAVANGNGSESDKLDISQAAAAALLAWRR